MRKRWMPLLIALGGALLFTLSGEALAGTYQVLSCSQAPSGTNNSWQEFNSDPTHLSSGQVCPPNPGSGEPVKSTGMFATDNLGSSSNAPDGATAGSRFTAPAGTTIVGLQDDRYLGAYSDNGWSPFVKADSTVLETCTFSFPAEGCTVGGPFGSSSLNGLVPVGGASTLSVGVECTSSIGCSEGATLHSAWAALYGAKVTLSELAPPSIASPNGTLWGPGPANGFHKGTEQVSFQASDLTGISKTTVSVDGSPVSTQQGACDFTHPLPCQPSSPIFMLDTTKLEDGTHTVALDAYNAAGNDTRQSEQVIVVNKPPPPPVGISAVQQADGSFRVSWSDPAHLAPITDASYQLCPPLPQGCAAPVDSGKDQPITIINPRVSGWSVRVWLTDAAGNASPTNAASVALTPRRPEKSETSHVGQNGNHPDSHIGISHRLKGNSLAVTLRLPKGSSSVLLVTLEAYHGKRRFARAVRHIRAHKGIARATFSLSHGWRRATVLIIHAAASGALATSIVVHPLHSTAR
jgi:hypothetical protein